MKTNYVKVMKSIIATLLTLVMVLLSAFTMPVSVAQAKTAAKTPTFTKSSYYVLVKETYKISIQNKIKGSTYVWATSDKKVATVSKDGTVKGISKGTVTITCKVKTTKKVYNLKSKVTIVAPAKSFKIYNKIKAMNVGQEYDLNRVITPSSSNDKTIWTSSNKKIAVPDQNGKFTALKEGKVTITGKTLSGKSDSVTIKVVDAEGIVATQDELYELLGTGVSKITIKTDEKVTFVIPEDDYSTTKLVVDAPKADVKNYGVFASVDIKSIAANTWYEYAVGNLLNILATDSRIVVAPGAVVKIEVSESGAKLVIENNGVVQEVVVDKPADIDISGKSTQSIPVVVNVANITITTSIPLALDCKAKITLVLEKGAEGTTVAVESDKLIPEVKGDVKVNVTIGTGENATTKTVDGSSSSSSGGAGGGGGGNNGGGGNPTSATYTIASLDTLKSIDVNYNGTIYDVSATMVTLLRFFLTNGGANSWRGTIDETHHYTSASNKTVTVRVEATSSGENTKKVTISGDSFGSGRVYTATINESAKSVQITSQQTNKTFTVTMSGSNSITISQIPTGLSFTEHY